MGDDDQIAELTAAFAAAEQAGISEAGIREAANAIDGYLEIRERCLSDRNAVMAGNPLDTHLARLTRQSTSRIGDSRRIAIEECTIWTDLMDEFARATPRVKELQTLRSELIRRAMREGLSAEQLREIVQSMARDQNE